MMQMAFAKHVTRPCQSCHLLVFVLLEEPFAPSGLLLFREQPILARGRSSRSTDVSSSFCRLSVTRIKMAGVSPVCLFVVLGHDVDFEKRCVSDSEIRTAATDGRDSTRCAIVSGGRLQSAGEHQATNSRTSLPDALCNLIVLAWEPERNNRQEAILVRARQQSLVQMPASTPASEPCAYGGSLEILEIGPHGR
jgi:hypothetical protein